MLRQQKTTHGFVAAEVIVSMSLLGLLVIGMAVSMHGFSMFNRLQWARQRCIAAAQAQLDSLAITGQSLSEQDVERLWPKVSLTTDRSQGSGQWAGLELLAVTAAAQAGPREVTIRMTRYVEPAQLAEGQE